jgi:hypothetical protein
MFSQTHTMEGTEGEPGINFRMLYKIFELIRSGSKDEKDSQAVITVTVSYLEIYNEEIKDLLSSKEVQLLQYAHHYL